MFQPGDHVLYCLHGVCRVDAIENKSFADISQSYYILKPEFDKGSTVFIPTTKEILVDKMHPLLTKCKIEQLIASLPDIENYWIDFEPERKEKYKELIECDNRQIQLAILKAILFHKNQLQNSKRKIHSSDEVFLKNVEKRLYEEFSFVLGKSKEAISLLIKDNLGFSIDTLQ